MALIRAFEERLLALFDQGELFGTTHCYIGQEADAVAVVNQLRAGDIVFSNHRCHGHFLVYSDRPKLLLAEVMGRDTGLVGGRGGSQHICFESFYSNGVQGGIVANAVGAALAEKMSGRDSVTVVFLGDGTLGEGIVYESLNMASLWSAPVLFVVEDNRWAQSTPVEKELAGDMVARGRAFGISASEITSTDAVELYAHFAALVERVRETRRPHFEVIHTYRLCHHSKSDDQRPEDEVERHRAGDPLTVLASRLEVARAKEIIGEAEQRIDAALLWARAQPFPEPSELVDGAT
ncbi:MAG: thiamine pyrophosphate-dependent dehydrogenase E1 component subunit alpha [Sandaracinaceae bacterium]